MGRDCTAGPDSALWTIGPEWPVHRVPCTAELLRRIAEARTMAGNSFGARAGLDVGDRSLEVFRLDALDSVGDAGGLPFSLKVLLENLLRNEDGSAVTAEDIEAFARWDPAGAEDRASAFC